MELQESNEDDDLEEAGKEGVSLGENEHSEDETGSLEDEEEEEEDDNSEGEDHAEN